MLKTAVVFGGAGFIGSHIVQELAKRNYYIKVVCTTPSTALYLKAFASYDQILLVQSNYSDDDLDNITHNSDVIINTIGSLSSNNAKLDKQHIEIPQKIALSLARNNSNARFIHFSAIGSEIGSCSYYAHTKFIGEMRVKDIYKDVTIVRPSVVFGDTDKFINQFATYALWLPFVVIAGANTLFQPIYVNDVANACMKIVENDETKSKTYELGGVDIISFHDIIAKILQIMESNKKIVCLNDFTAKIMAGILSILPNPPLTKDQLIMLKHDNIISKQSVECNLTIQDLGIQPTSLDEILPDLLIRFRETGEFVKYGNK